MRVAWEAALDDLGADGLERGVASGEWLVRDVLAHVNGWDRWQLVQLRCAFTGETPTDNELTCGIVYPPNDAIDEDSMNAMFIAGARERPLEEIVRHWREVSAMRAEWVAAASQAQLNEVIGNDWSSPRVIRLASEVPSVGNPTPVWQFILDQVDHQRRHLLTVRDWMGR